MSIRKTGFVPAIILAALLQVAVVASAQEAANVWGGRHVSMEVTKSGADLEFDCATGSISEPLPLDRSGTFEVKGTFTPEHGGPVRENEAPASRNAIYSGTVDGDTLHLHVAVEGISEDQDYTLTRGKPARVTKCR